MPSLSDVYWFLLFFLLAYELCRFINKRFSRLGKLTGGKGLLEHKRLGDMEFVLVVDAKDKRVYYRAMGICNAKNIALEKHSKEYISMDQFIIDNFGVYNFQMRTWDSGRC